MSAYWQIKGQTGKALDATLRDADAAGVTKAAVDFAQLDADVFSWQVDLADLAATGALLPEQDQTVELWRNGSRFFHGTAMRPTQACLTANVEVVGPWWWLAKIPLGSSVAGADGVSKVRQTYGFNAQNIATSITALLNAAATAGAPFTVGTIDTCYPAPAITLQSDTWAGALSELCRLVPDGMLWFDYSASPAVVNFSRRSGSAAAITLDGRDLNPGWSMVPLPELQQERIVVSYAGRQTDGRTVYLEQASGTATKAGGTQYYTVSGPEVGADVPDTQVETYTPGAVSVTSSWLAAYVYSKLGIDPATVGYHNFMGIGNSTAIAGRLPTYTAASTTQYTTMPLLVSEAGVPRGYFPSAFPGLYARLGSQSLPSWAAGLSLSEFQIDFSGEIWLELLEYEYGSSNQVVANGVVPAWWGGFQWSLKKHFFRTDVQGYYYTSHNLYTVPFSVTIPMVNTNASRIYQPFDYDFTAPPSGMAAGMLACVSWLPWQGTLALTEQEAGGTRYRGNKVSVSNAMTALATAGALVAGEQIDIDSGTTTITPGAPPKFDVKEFPDKLRRAPQDNLIIL